MGAAGALLPPNGIPPLPREGQGRGLNLLILLQIVEVDGRLVALDGLECRSLYEARGDWLEGGVVDEVGEFLSWGEDDVDLLDVGGGELLESLGSGATDGESYGAESVEDDLVAVEDLFAQACCHVGEHSLDGALGEHGVVLCHVRDEVFGGEGLSDLGYAVGLWCFASVHGVGSEKY